MKNIILSLIKSERGKETFVKYYTMLKNYALLRLESYEEKFAAEYLGKDMAVIADPRPMEEQQLDWYAEEVPAGSTPVINSFYNENNLPELTFLNQKRTEQCVGFSVVHSAEMYLEQVFGRPIKARLSPYWVYQFRDNKPGNGMYIKNAAEIAVKYGLMLEDFVPTPLDREILKKNEHIMLDPKVGWVVKPSGYKFVPRQSYESILQYAGKNPVVSFGFGKGEWFGQDVAKHKNIDATMWHGVCVVGVHKGELMIADSARRNRSWAIKEGIRKVGREFYEMHNTGAFYFLWDMERKEEVDITPRDILAEDTIKLGDKGESVVALQTYLQLQGLFRYSGGKGYFGEVTRKALAEWQIINLGRSYGGTHWAGLSQKKYNELKG